MKGSDYYMYKSFKFRIYPNKEQLELLNKSFECSRFIYNYYLSKIISDASFAEIISI